MNEKKKRKKNPISYLFIRLTSPFHFSSSSMRMCYRFSKNVEKSEELSRKATREMEHLRLQIVDLEKMKELTASENR